MKHNPQPIGSILADLMAKRGFARIESARIHEAAWREAAGELAAAHSRVGALSGGRLEIVVNGSVLLQELTLKKRELLDRLRRLLPDEDIRDVRFRIGAPGSSAAGPSGG